MPTFVAEEEEKQEAAPIQLVCETAFFLLLNGRRGGRVCSTLTVCVRYIMKATLRLRRVSKHFRKGGRGISARMVWGKQSSTSDPQQYEV